MKALRFLKFNLLTILYSFFCVLLYYTFAYELNRADFPKLLALYTALFIFSYKLIEQNKQQVEVLVVLALLFRLVFLFATPNLSQDFYRFIWDGNLTLAGLSPYESTPQEWANSLNAIETILPNYKALIAGMGSLNAGNYTNYPPLSQEVYALTAWLFGSDVFYNILGLRIVLILTDLGILYVGSKIMQQLNLPLYRMFWFVLNPFVLIELSGNLHLEGIMLLCLLVSLYALLKNNWILAALFFGLSVLAKLFTLVLLPIFLYYFLKKKGLNFYKLIGFYALLAALVIVGFVPFITQNFLLNFGESIGLWFTKFEFNASIYYVLREIGFYFTGYNLIAVFGKLLALFTFLVVLLVAFFRKNYPSQDLFIGFLFAFCTYLLFSTTVHPWYLSLPLLLSVFTRYKFMLLWSFCIVLSYSAYHLEFVEENLYLVGLEYALVLGFFLVEVYKVNKQKKPVVL